MNLLFFQPKSQVKMLIFGDNFESVGCGSSKMPYGLEHLTGKKLTQLMLRLDVSGKFF